MEAPNSKRFIEVCQQEQLPVVLRLGPFCHGEVCNGGIPDWVFTKGCKTRDENPVFLGLVERLYRQIFTQVQGLQWKDGGPVMAAYHRCPYIYPEDAYSMAIVKLGSGSNLLGYYMYHGGTNPEGLTYLNETQRTSPTFLISGVQVLGSRRLPSSCAHPAPCR